jgi:hypothetical protein
MESNIDRIEAWVKQWTLDNASADDAWLQIWTRPK